VLSSDLRAALIAACLALILQPLAALGATDCTTAPSCAISIPGPIVIEQGESVQFAVTGQSHCEGDIFIETINAPQWCEQLRGNDDANVSFLCTPPDAGTYTLMFRVVDDENDMSDIASVTIEARGVDCELAPQCVYSFQSNPMNPFIITAGETRQVEFTYYSPCPTSTLVFSQTSNAPDFCTVSQPVPDGNGNYTVSISCSPGQLDSSLSNESHAGSHQLTLRVVDLFRDEFQDCTLFIHVPPPDGCSGQPTCGFTNPGPIEIVAGETSQIEFCYEAGCPTSEVVANSNGPLPDFCTMSAPTPASGSAGCVTLTCSPALTDIGPHEIKMSVVDVITVGIELCSIQVAVVAPPECVAPPTCEFVQSGPVEVLAGESTQFEFRWSPGCTLSTANLFNETLLPFCTRSAITTDSEGNRSITITCSPTLADAGMHTQSETVQDNFNFLKATCSIDIEVLEPCPDEPTCYFTRSGPIEVAVGELVDFEFCGSSGCGNHRSRIEMISRPPFISPAGHKKGGPGETLCLPIKGTPGPQHAGSSWSVRVRSTNITTGQVTECSILMHVVEGDGCQEPPVCEIMQGDEIEVGLDESFAVEICAASSCNNGAIKIEPLEPTELCDSFGMIEGNPGEELCASLPCGTNGISEPGEYLVRFLVTDTGNGQSSICETLIIVGGGSLGCVEEEPNSDISLCSMLDARACLRIACGDMVSGYLDPSGDDVDVYCIEGLSPGEVYGVQIIGGVNRDLEFTCAQAVCLDDSGARIGNAGGDQSTIECAADDAGTLFIGVSGCGDLDLDGRIDDESRGNPPHGAVGAYQILISPTSVLDEASIPCHADMNSDGMVDSADLGMLIGVFGEICAP